MHSADNGVLTCMGKTTKRYNPALVAGFSMSASGRELPFDFGGSGLSEWPVMVRADI